MIRKNIITLLMLMLCATLSPAATIHWITFIDTTDPNVGDFDKVGRELLYNHFINPINAALAEKGYQSNTLDFHGDKVSPLNCEKIVRDLNVGSDDIVMFYYIGHGFHSNEDAKIHKFPFMNLGLPNSIKTKEELKMLRDQSVSLEWVHNTLKAKGARLTATIGMCCNNIFELINRKSGSPIANANYGSAYLTGSQLQSIQRMFCDYSGDFIATSASPGQSSRAIGFKTPEGKEIGIDTYTFQLVSVFEDDSKKGSLDWDALFSKVGVNVGKLTMDVYRAQQNPIFINNLKKNSSQVARKDSSVSRNTSSVDVSDANQVGNWLSANIDYIIEKNTSTIQRRETVDEMMKMFSDDAEIKTISQDGNIVIDKQSARDFFDRVNTSRLLIKVVPESYKYMGNKITSMKVYEYYKK